MQGRPTIYSPELALKICTRLSLGESLRTICKDEEMPVTSTVHLWVLENRGSDIAGETGFSEQYARARALQAENMFDEILDIADTADDIVRSGAEKKSSAFSQNQRLRVDTRKWYLSKVLPKKFGDKLDLTTDGEKIETPIYGGLSVQRHDGDQKDIPTS